MPAVPRRLILLALLAAAAGGCGDDDDTKKTAQTATQPAPPPAQTTTGRAEATSQPETPAKTTPEAVAPKKRALEREGNEVRNSGVAGVRGAQGALELPLEGGGGLTVIAFDTADQAERHAAQYRELAEKYPDYFRVEVRGTTLYLGVAEQPEKLSKTGFADAVEAAEKSS